MASVGYNVSYNCICFVTLHVYSLCKYIHIHLYMVDTKKKLIFDVTCNYYAKCTSLWVE